MAKPRVKDLSYENIDNGFLRLCTKPSARMAYSFVPSATRHPNRPEPLLVFLGGLDNPKVLWQKSLNKLFEFSCAISTELPAMLFYDRFGVGQSDPDPTDAGKVPEEYHDVNDAVGDLYQLIVQIMEDKYSQSRTVPSKLPPIVFCAHSFGACVGRLFTASHPGVVQALLMADCAIAPTIAEDLIPNPDDPLSWARRQDGKSPWSLAGFPDETVVTKKMARDARRSIQASPISGYAMTLRERMRWDNMPQLLPYNDGPKLRGPTPSLPLVTVLRSDPVVVGPRQAKLLNMAEALSVYGLVPMAVAFQSKLHHIQPLKEGKNLIVHGSGHMIHLDAPELVARELLELLVNSSQMLEKSRI